jgi:hypothetical protein
MWRAGRDTGPAEVNSIGLEGAALPNPPQPHMHADHGEHAEPERNPNAEADQLAARRQRGDPLQLFLS